MTLALLSADPQHPLSQALALRLGVQPHRTGTPLGDDHTRVVLLHSATASPIHFDPGLRSLLEVAPWHLALPDLAPGGARLRHAALCSEFRHQDESLTLERLLIWPYGNGSMAWLADPDLETAIEDWLHAPWCGERWLEGPEAFSAEQTAAAISTALEHALASPADFAALKFEVCDRDGDRMLEEEELGRTLLHAGVSAGEVSWVLEQLGHPAGIDAELFSRGLTPALQQALAEQQAAVQTVRLTGQAAVGHLVLEGWREETARSLGSASPPASPPGTSIRGGTALAAWLRPRVIDWIPVELVPALGVLSRRSGKLEGEPALLFTYRLANGRVAELERSLDFRCWQLRWRDAAPGGEEISWSQGERLRSLRLVDQTIMELRVRGHWPELNRAEKLLISGEPLPRWMVVLFRRSGQFQLEQEMPRGPADPICRCARVSCGRLAELINRKATADLRAIARQTRVTSVCGGCIPIVESWLAAGGPMPPGTQIAAAPSALPIDPQSPAAGSSLQPVVASSAWMQPIQERSAEARPFLEQCYGEQGLHEVIDHRICEVEEHLQRDGTYRHTYDELAYGARLAWRNSTRCLGRHLWRELDVRDRRDLDSEAEMFAAIVEHISAATNGGDLRSTITVFRPDGRRIWNPQFCRYAGYRQPDGSVLGDPMQLTLTEAVLAMGWDPGERTRFDLLPIVIQRPGRQPHWFELPQGLILEVPIRHPQYSWFADLDLRWYALPAVSNLAFDCGGIQYTAAPFNGFYMGTEIGACNFSDLDRYNQLPLIAAGMGLDTSSERTLWRDRAVVELNVAILHSYEQAGVRMADHHSLTESFMQFSASEHQCGRRVQAEPRYVVPAISASLTPTFHAQFDGNQILKPNFFMQPDPWPQSAVPATAQAGFTQTSASCPFH